MRKVTISFDVFTFAELEPTAKQEAIMHARESMQYPAGDEIIETLNKLVEQFGATIRDYRLNWDNARNSCVQFRNTEKMTAGEVDERLTELGEVDPQTGEGLGDCKLTGVCWDEDALDGFRSTWKARGELPADELVDIDAELRAAFESLAKSAESDYEAQYDEENFAETCEANNWEFLGNGKFYHGQTAESYPHTA